MIFKCERCGCSFTKPETGRIRKIIVGSMHAVYKDVNVLKTVILCPNCALNFKHWLNYKPRRTQEEKEEMLHDDR